MPIVIAIAAVLIIAIVGVTIGVIVSRKPAQDNTLPTLPYTTPGSPTYDTGSPGGTSSVPSTATSTPQDPGQRLRQIASEDHAFVSAQLADRWVPQLSSKRPGVVDNGVVWDNAMTLQEHQQLRQRFSGARLLWSGDWSTFSAPDFWVTVAGITFPNSAGALAWCKGQGFDRDHCIAKIISTTHPVDGSTAYN